MVKILNIISWLISISIGIGITAINIDFFVLGLIAFFLIKIIFSKGFIEDEILKYNKNLEEQIIKKLKLQNLGIDFRQIDVEEKQIVHNETITSFNQAVINSGVTENESTKSEENIIKETPVQEEIKKENIIIPKKPSKIEIFMKEFFAENLFAKIGGILLTLGVIFLMSLVYSIVGPILKIIIGFAVGFGVYLIGVFLNKKGFKTESLILFGTGILINYVVILGGRYFIGDDNGLFSAGLTFLFLILNTVFSILTSYLYSSKNILLFSIFFAYFIPLIIGSSGTKYSFVILTFYSVIISIGALFISQKEFLDGNTLVSKILFYFSLILGNGLLLLTPVSNDLSFITKIIGFNIISFSCIFIAYKNKFSKDLLILFVISFVFLSLNIFSGVHELGNNFNSIGIFLSYFAGIILLLGGIVFFMTIGLGNSLIYIIFFPFLIVLGLLFNSSLLGGLFIIPIFFIIYLFIFAFTLANITSTLLKYIFFAILGIFIGISNFYFPIFDLTLNLNNFLIVSLSAFMFLISSYYLSFKKDLSYFYSIGTLFFIIIFLPIIRITGNIFVFSVMGIMIFGIINYILQFFNQNLVKNDFVNLVLGSILGVLFVGGNLYVYGLEYFPGVTLGLAFLVLAIIYFIGSYVWFLKIDKNSEIETSPIINIFYNSTGISISIFSIAIALIFSNNPFIVSLIWLVESSILFFFSTKVNSFKIFVSGVILFFIGIFKYFLLLADFSFANINDLASILLIIISLFLNSYFIQNSIFKEKIIVKILHFIGLILVFISLPDAISLTRTDFSYLYAILFIGIAGIIYNLFKDNFSKITHLVFLGILFFLHLFITERFELYYYNYLFTSLGLLYLVIELLFFKDKITKYLFLIVSAYFFIITSIFLYDLTNDAFSLTIYWGILSLVGVHVGILRKNKQIRSIGLYLLIITLLKISLYDVWSSIDNPLLRIIAFMFVGGIMMYISTLYSKNKLSFKEDFLFDYFQDKKVEDKIN